MVQAFYPAPGLAGFKAGRAEMLAVEFTVAQGAKKSPATLAGQHGLFLRMIKTTRLALDHDGLAARPRINGAEQGRKNLHLQGDAARGAGRDVGPIEQLLRQPRMTLGALNPRIHGLFVTTRVSQIRSCKARF